MPQLIKAVGKWLMVVSLCTALGLDWAVLQSIAWVGMLFNYSRSGSVVTAVEKTFDGRHPCPLCMAIRKSQENRKKQEFPSAAGKLDIVLRSEAVLLTPPMRDFQWPTVVLNGVGFSPEPGVPPPRAA